ncbi:MAG: Lrp/AsnC family transcriptional regulator, partial [Desulfomicrobium sp.]|nr:Lrp/AsnC family transcriptional regulator [Desulfomicrobium sp.]
MDFTQTENAILRIVQDTLPDSATPYADIARQTGSTEEEVLALLKKLKEGGQIRRIGATLRHQQAGSG